MDVSLNSRLHVNYAFTKQNPTIRFGLFEVVNPIADMRSVNSTLIQKVLLHLKNQRTDRFEGVDPDTDYQGYIRRDKDGLLQVRVSHTLDLRNGNVNRDVVQAKLTRFGNPLEVSYQRSEGPKEALHTESIKILPNRAFQRSGQEKSRFKLQRVREYLDNQSKALNGAMHMIDQMLQFFYISMRKNLLQPNQRSQAIHHPHRRAA